MIRRHFIAAALLSPLVVGAPARARRRRGSGLPVPRFVSIDADAVNVRAGPGKRYPVRWKFVREGLPVMVVEEFKDWHRIRDSDGAEGWVHTSLLSGRRMALVRGTTRPLRRAPDRAAPILLLAEAGVQGRLLGCRPLWCKIEIADRIGWMQRLHFFGALDEEIFD